MNTFMSDDAPAFYNAWKDVMGEARRQLLCTWHVNKSLQEGIRRHVKGKEAQEFTYKVMILDVSKHACHLLVTSNSLEPRKNIDLLSNGTIATV